MPERRSRHDRASGQYVYAVLPAGRVPDEALIGIDSAPVEYVVVGDLVAAASSVARDRSFGRRADLLTHSRVVEQLSRATTAVPVRFGSVLTDRASIASEFLEPGQEHFRGLLVSLDGVAQFNLRASFHRDPVLAEIVRDDHRIAGLRAKTRDLPPGTMHPDLLALGEAVATAWDRKRDDESEAILDVILPIVAELVTRPVTGDHLLDAAMLVEQTRRDELETLLEDLAEDMRERIRLRLIGPLPAYDFVGEVSWA